MILFQESRLSNHSTLFKFTKASSKLLRCSTLLPDVGVTFEGFHYRGHKRMVRFQKLIKIYFSPYTTTTYIAAATATRVPHALSTVRLSFLLRGSGTSFQDGVPAREGFPRSPF
jgi:hypothetical protein